MLALAAVAFAGLLPVGPPPSPPPGPPAGATIHHHILVSGRLKAGAVLTVSAYESYDLPNTPGFTPQPSTLCYQHGTSRRLCTLSQVSRWSVRLRSGNDQFLTVRAAGKTVARVVYRDVQIAGPPEPAEAPLDLAVTPPSSPTTPLDVPTPRSAPGGLSGPASLKVGAQAYFWGPLRPGMLCYRHGTSRVSCMRSLRDGFYITVGPGHDQYFALRIGRNEVSRLVYHHVT